MPWVEQLQETVRGAEFYGPDAMGNPTPGQWTVIGPTGLTMSNGASLERASLLVLVHFCRHPGARAALKKEKP